MSGERPFYEHLAAITAGLPPVPKRYELRCHPDVYLALRNAEPVPEYVAPASAPVYGTADIIVLPELGSGEWGLYEGGEMIKSGRLGDG